MSKEEYIEHLQKLSIIYRQMNSHHEDMACDCLKKWHETNEEWMVLQDQLMIERIEEFKRKKEGMFNELR
jgi:hypothetical protein